MVGVTVREVLTLPALRGSYVVAGNRGLERRVIGVNVMEVPDIESFVKGGELLLTTGYPLRDHPDELSSLVRTLARLGLAALAIKTGRYIERLPPAVLEAADELGLPVIAVGESVSFNEVIGAVLAVVLTEYGAEPDNAEAIRERLTGVALAGGGLDEIARTLSGALARPVLVVDPEGNRLGSGSGPDRGVGRPASWTFPISVAGFERGRIVVGGDTEPSLGQRRLIRQACFAAAMHIAQALASLELDRQMRVLFLEELVAGKVTDDALVKERSRLFGWDLSVPHQVVIAACDVDVRNPSLAAASRWSLPRGSISWRREHQMVALVPVDTGTGNPNATEWLERWRSRLMAAGGGSVIVAAGGIASSVGDLPAAHDAARESLAIAQAIGRPVVEHRALALERVIRSVPREKLKELIEQEIGALIIADRVNGSDLCATLEMFLETSNAAEAARRLHVHYNTLKHRIARVGELIPADLHDPSTRSTLAFALRARALL